jgi:hypothetical protein
MLMSLAIQSIDHHGSIENFVNIVTLLFPFECPMFRFCNNNITCSIMVLKHHSFLINVHNCMVSLPLQVENLGWLHP